MLKFIKEIVAAFRHPPAPNWHIEKQAKPLKSHPLGGFWKKNQSYDHGLAIGKVSESMYFISFCGPGGCFEKGIYRPNSTIEGDPAYRVIDTDTIEVKTKKGFEKYTRASGR